MSEWGSVELRNLFDLSIPGEWGNAPDGINDTYVLRAADFTKDCKLKTEIGAPRVIPTSKLIQRRLEKGDLLLEKSGGSPDQPVGRVVYFNRDGDNFSLSNFLQLLRVNKKFDSLWAYYLLTALYDSNVVLRYQQQTTGIINFKLEEYLSEMVDAPFSIGEQQKIANILSTVDKLIENTQTLIDKYTAIKQGMMADLFTRGIDLSPGPDGTPASNPNYGQLRPSVKDTPDLYKETELGCVPKDWDVVLMDKYASRGSGHTPSKSFPEYWNGGIKWVSLADSSKLDNLYIYDTDKEISELGLSNSSATKHPAGTVILSRDAGIGKSAILGEVMAVSQHFMAWRCGSNADSYFLYFWMQYMKPSFENIAMGSTIPTIGLDYFKRLKIAVPSTTQEQIMIGQRILSVHESICKYAVELKKYQIIKKGLMQDLLAGKVKVS